MKTGATDLPQYFFDRNDAGILLADKIQQARFHPDLIVTIPRGGVPVGMAMAAILGIPLRLCLVRKIGHPANPEFAIGAVSETETLLKSVEGIHSEFIEQSIAKERSRIKEISKKIGHAFSDKEIKGKTVLLVDDGIATGVCMELAIKVLKKAGAKKVGVAVPVCPAKTGATLKKEVDFFISLLKPEFFSGVGAYYEDFGQLTDEQVARMLA